jgi:hypothetical protein
MSIFTRLFGKRSSGPTPDEVIAHAIATLAEHAPTVKIEREGATALKLTVGERLSIWNLANPIRLAAGDADWKAGVTELAQKVVEQLSTPRTSEPPSTVTADTVVVLVMPQVKLQGFGFEVVTDPFVGGLGFFYGVRGGGKIGSITPEALAASGLDRAALRAHAIKNLQLSAESLQLAPLQPGAPVLTNQVGSLVAASLLADTATWKKLASTMGPLLVAVPAPSRLFVAPDRPEYLKAMQGVIELSLKMEEEILSTRILRFDGEQWSDEPVN